jgi:HprK-related kinase A
LNVAALGAAELRNRLHGDGLVYRVGPYAVRLRSSIDQVLSAFSCLYADYPVEPDDGFADFHVYVHRPQNLRRWYRPQAIFEFDGKVPFKPLPFSQSYPFFEWGLNWCVSNHISNHLIIHSAVLENRGQAVVMPGNPGVGKSTLCAALMLRGWRLLTDELGMLSVDDCLFAPVPRPVSLKNNSIDLIANFAPEAVIGPRCEDTVKGTVAHVRAPADSVARAAEKATPRLVVLPQYVEGANAQLIPLSRPEAAMQIAGNTFNYSRLGLQGFATLTRMIDGCRCFEFRYSRLDDAIDTFEQLLVGGEG